MTALLSKLQTTPSGVQSATDYLPYGQLRLTPEVWRYLEQGSGKGLTMQANAQALDDVKLMSRPLAEVKGGNTRLNIFGQQFEHPLLLAPIAYQRLFHPDGEQASAMAANAQSGQMVVSSLASQTLEEIIKASGQALWFQLYWQGNRPRTLHLLKRALAAGYSAVMFTVDAPVKQAVMQLPDGISAVNLEASLPMSAVPFNSSMVFDGWMTQAPTWDDLAWLRNQLNEPLLVKGILHLDDAKKILSLGCDGLVVSNHGGRVLDGVPGSLEMLPKIVKLVSGKAKVLFDSGIRSGQDAFKALALGADAVMVGRPYVWGLSTCGALGVAHVLRLMRDELEMTMALSGAENLKAIKVGKFLNNLTKDKR
jgi:4-hydroxymandelate oxidase